MSSYDFTPEDDIALTAWVNDVLERVEQRIGDRDRDRELLDAWALLRSYHDELIMRRQESRGLVRLVETLSAEIGQARS